MLDVDEDSPASQSLQRGDIIVSIEGEELESQDQAIIEGILGRYDQYDMVTVVVDGFVPESMLAPFMKDRTAFAGDEIETLAKVQGLADAYVLHVVPPMRPTPSGMPLCTQEAVSC